MTETAAQRATPTESYSNFGLTRQREVQAEPVRQVLDLTVDGRGHDLGEGDVLVDRVDPQHPGFAVGGGVELAHQLVGVQDRQREISPPALGRGLVHLQLVVELKKLDGPLAVMYQPVEG